MKKIAKIFGVIVLILIFLIGVSNFLAVDDLKEICDKSFSNCQKRFGAIVAISGGNTSARTSHAVELFQKNIAQKIIFSGAAADSNSPSNASAMKIQAMASGINSADILLDENSKNTHENAKFVREILVKNNIKDIVLVTSGYHQLRATEEFKKVLEADGIKVYGSPTRTDADWGKYWWYKPRGWYLALSEIAGLLRFYLGLGE